MNYTLLHWQSDWALNEILGIDYEEISEEENHVIGYYTLVDYPEVNLYINQETGKVIEVWLSEED